MMEANKSKTVEKLDPLIEECAKELNLVVLESTFTKENGHYYLRIYIYNSVDPITHKECSDFTRLLSGHIDDTDIINVPYSLEVSSPGINRKLKNPIEFKIFRGKPVKAILKKPISEENKQNVFIGTLLGLMDDQTTIKIEVDGSEVLIPLDHVKSINLEG